MIDGKQIIGFYEDCFGNEIDEYEQITRYTVYYSTALFDGDNDEYNEINIDNWQDAIQLYNVYGDIIHIKDNEYDVTFSYGEWY